LHAKHTAAFDKADRHCFRRLAQTPAQAIEAEFASEAKQIVAESAVFASGVCLLQKHFALLQACVKAATAQRTRGAEDAGQRNRSTVSLASGRQPRPQTEGRGAAAAQAGKVPAAASRRARTAGAGCTRPSETAARFRWLPGGSRRASGAGKR
jgi:hypothetical protein